VAGLVPAIHADGRDKPGQDDGSARYFFFFGM
jgi:hypothetical protein